MGNNAFVKLAEEEQKITFKEMENQEEIIRFTVDCAVKNLKLGDSDPDQHRFQY